MAKGVDMATDEELLVRLADEEDALVERKSKAHRSDVCAAVCAFANSLRAPATGVLFLGVDPKGQPTGSAVNPDKLQIDISSWITHCYPLIGGVEIHALRPQGKDVVAVVVPESRDRPHFTGPAFIRDGSQTREASREQFQMLVEDRSDLVWALKPWIGKRVSITQEHYPTTGSGAWTKVTESFLRGVNQFFVTIGSGAKETYSLKRIDLEHDMRRDQPRLRVRLK